MEENMKGRGLGEKSSTFYLSVFPIEAGEKSSKDKLLL